MKFTPPFHDNPDKLLQVAARLTLRLVLHCDDWLHKRGDDLGDLNSLYGRIQDLVHAYVLSQEGKPMNESIVLAAFAHAVAKVIADEPSLRTAVVAYLATKTDNDP
jgi:hypothetical protein